MLDHNYGRMLDSLSVCASCVFVTLAGIDIYTWKCFSKNATSPLVLQQLEWEERDMGLGLLKVY